MREILYKAQGQTDKKWYFGLPNYIGESACEIKYRDINGLYKVAICDASTLCQYTGLQDKNGNKIFEGDIVRYENNMECGIGAIEIMDFLQARVRWIRQNTAFPTFYSGISVLCCADEVEVIGSIHDRSGNSEPDN